ncbi:MAG: glycosyltransferase family 2 protein [Actinobacteria bacterium]|nr:MAG: glycosyltransferase family 2 protein [Actinomycetota bacterium]
MRDPEVSVVIPVYNEGAAIVGCLRRILREVMSPCEILVVHDMPDDTTVAHARPVVAADPRVRLVLNTYGPGPANAIRYGIDTARSPVCVVTMADGCDDPQQIDTLARLVDRGVVVAAASRYMPGGQQVGGPRIKRLLSRLAGRSRTGFEIGLELTAKAARLGLPVAEIPTIWLDRRLGQSRFDLWRFLPGYLKWYFAAFGRRPNVVDPSRAEGAEVPADAYVPAP